ncbi:hypothetical protein CANARDRAFT_150868 [[Candida] arabinofermentans NRRL YB-2248]|uniref:Uncharacterized protein n=1 Tax=[Candida] arabinofermentans NRRL YB-2248 TaxID=983967 RepID=A0A1E4T0U5_9ASCO|nr:hypothetical protein CANARDRAFT_150868 [[Candida] arabinofermentans NRRL YB-2248]
MKLLFLLLRLKNKINFIVSIITSHILKWRAIGDMTDSKHDITTNIGEEKNDLFPPIDVNACYKDTMRLSSIITPTSVSELPQTPDDKSYKVKLRKVKRSQKRKTKKPTSLKFNDSDSEDLFPKINHEQFNPNSIHYISLIPTPLNFK